MGAVAAGGLVGSSARALVDYLDRGGGFPTEVLLVNLTGSFLLGLYLARRERSLSGATSLRFWAIGVLGAFTTFSTFSVDVVLLLQEGRPGPALAYVAASALGGMVAAVAGLRLGARVR